jgi:uncharacterized protein (DUF983 family)
MSIIGVVGMALFMWFEFNIHPPVWMHMAVTMAQLAPRHPAPLERLNGQ